MDLQTNKLVIKLVFELEIITDLNINPKNVINTIANEIQIKKKYNEFSISSCDMNYEVHTNEEMIDV